jgi:hypothetical protein
VSLLKEFNRLYDSLQNSIEENPNWYYGFNLRGAIYHPNHRVQLQPGEMVKSVDKFHRRVIFVGTALGPIAIHEFGDGVATTVHFEASEELIVHKVFVRSGCEISLGDLMRIDTPYFQKVVYDAKESHNPPKESFGWNSVPVEEVGQVLQRQLKLRSDALGRLH